MYYTATYNENCFLSSYNDDYAYTGGAHGTTFRQSDTWNLENGKLVPLSYFFYGKPNYKADIINEINNQIAKELEVDQGKYFDNYTELVNQYFDPKNYYLSPLGLEIYFPLYSIAPYSTGIATFTIPFSMLTRKPVCSQKA